MQSGFENTGPVKGEKRDGKEDIPKLVRDCLNDAWEADQDNRREAAQDMEFLAGNQWPEAVRQERLRDGRPMLTINRLPQFIRQVTNDLRQSDPAIRVSPVDDESDPELAKIYDGLIRQIQYQSAATHVYANAADHQVGCGMGYWRVKSQYVDDASFDQELRIELIPNPLSVYFDPAAVLPDRSDAQWCIVTEEIPKKSFKARYPKASTDSIDKPTEGYHGTLRWDTNDHVRIAEFWRKVPVDRELALLEDGSTIDVTSLPKDMRAMLGVAQVRKVKSHKVEMYLVSGGDVLEEKYEHPGKYIPIVPLIGAEIPLEKGKVRHGMIRFARDPQQLYNFYRTATAETIALQPKTPWLVTMRMISKFKNYWDTSHVKNRPYLPYEVDPKAPGAAPKREAPPVMPTALMQEAAIAQDDMKATTGIYDAALGAQGNETSGKAINARKLEGDTANYHYADNLERSLWHTGRILVDLIPKIYDNQRVVRLMGDDGEEETARINFATMDIDGLPIMVNDLSAARFDVRVKIGQSYTSKRVETADTMLELMGKIPPEQAAVLTDIMVSAMDIPDAEKIAKRLRNMIPPQILLDPENPEDMAQLQQMQQPQQPDPMQEAAMQLEFADKQAQVRRTTAEAEGKELDNMMRALQPVTPQVVDIR